MWIAHASLVIKMSVFFDGGHLKTGHRSTLQNRSPRAWRPRPSVVDRSGSAAGRAADRSLQRVVGRHFQAPLFLLSQTFGSQRPLLFCFGRMFLANLPFLFFLVSC